MSRAGRPRRGRPALFPALLPVLFLAALALAGPWLVPWDPLSSAAGAPLSPPSAAHWFGTDQLGRDVLSRVVAGARLDLGIAVAAVGLALLPGALIGSLAALSGGIADRVTGRLTEMLMAFPLFVLALALAAMLGASVASVVLATALINLPFYIRLSRAGTAALRGADWVAAARLAGHGPAGIALRRVLPALLPLLAVQGSVNLGWAVLNAAGLSFLGLGVPPPAPEWGVMVAEGARYALSGAWWLVACPGGALVLAVLAFSLAGDALRERLDPGAGA